MRRRILRNPFESNSLRNVNSHNHLEWHEAAADNFSPTEERVDDNQSIKKISRWKFLVLIFIFVFLFRLSYLQAYKGDEYAAIADSNRTRARILLAPRGFILDRNGQVLVQNKPSFNLVVTPNRLPKDHIAEQAQKVSSIMNVPVDEILQKIEKGKSTSFQSIVIKTGLTPNEILAFETKQADLLGFEVDTVPVRDYKDAQVFAHVLGYTSLISAEELEKLDTDVYNQVDYIGKSGIELSYESYLKGIDGRQSLEVDARGDLRKDIGKVDPVTGNTLVLNIDKDLQSEVYKYFTTSKIKTKGAAVVMNPKNGQILSLLSLPSFDNNIFSDGLGQGEYQQLISDKDLPLFNRAVAGQYPPGSTVKPMVGLAVLAEGIVKENTTVVDNGVIVIPNQYDPNISYNFYGWKRDGLGPMNVKFAIAKSSDIYFYVVTGGHSTYPGITPLGATRLANWYRKFGLGKPLGIDISGEKGGVVADPKWKAEYFKGDAVMSKWYQGDTYHIGIGQGDMLVTPLQAAFWTSVIANNGVGYKPYIADSVKDANNNTIKTFKPEVLVKDIADISYIKTVQGGMRETIVSGSGASLSSLSVECAGKTGTSQFDGADPTKTHAWFTAYCPYKDPEIVVTVLVEAGGEGHAAAVPIVKNLVKWWSENRYNK